jgi:hypothetical protein
MPERRCCACRLDRLTARAASIRAAFNVWWLPAYVATWSPGSRNSSRHPVTMGLIRQSRPPSLRPE